MRVPELRYCDEETSWLYRADVQKSYVVHLDIDCQQSSLSSSMLTHHDMAFSNPIAEISKLPLEFDC